MADPLGAMASILVLLNVCGKIIEYIQEVKDGSSERTRLMMEICSTKGILESLIATVKRAEEAAEAWSETIRYLNQKGGPLDLLREVLVALHDELSRVASAKGVARMGKNLIWPFKKKEVEERLRVIDGQKLLLILALDSDHVALPKAIQRDTRAVGGDVAATPSGIDAQDYEQQPCRPTPATTSVQSEPEPERDRAAANPAKPVAEYNPSISSIAAIIHETSELVRTSGSIFNPNEFANRASDSLGDDEGSSEYRYSPLSEQGCIRLLRLMPHEDEKTVIQCQLFEYPLKKLAEGIHLYEALSYVWGSEDNRQPVYIQSDDISDDYPPAKRKRGFDHAICINQRDKDEKGQQVQSMAEIYAKARGVIVWLGEAGDNSDQALKVIHKAAEEQHANSPIEGATQHATLLPSDQQPTNSTIHETTQQAISTLLGRPWFQRIWLKEMILEATDRSYEEAVKNIRKALEVYGTTLRSVDNTHRPWIGPDEEAVRVMDDLLIEDKGAAVEARYKEYSQTPLCWAAENGREAVVQLLLDKGANIEAKDNDGRTPLSWAVEKGHEAVIKLLLDKGANIEAKDNDGRTPLSWAAFRGHEAVVKVLLTTGNVDADSKDNSRQTPLWWAAENGHEAIDKLLLTTGNGDADLRDDSWRTPLSWAAENGHEAIDKLLLTTGNVDANLRDDFGQTPLFWAARYGHEAVVKLLLTTGNCYDMFFDEVREHRVDVPQRPGRGERVYAAPHLAFDFRQFGRKTLLPDLEPMVGREVWIAKDMALARVQ
ncbi:hypothetical protein DL771_001168 [Monosporascus sp. 5C6A]|nr:hypothetical protein DL771_001168 [Monosporascus sp. 5C6A]